MISLTSCGGNPRDANNDNFQRAIDVKLGTGSKLCLSGSDIFSQSLALPYRMLVGKLPPAAVNPMGVTPYEPGVHGQLEALVSAKLATKRTTTVKAQHFYQYLAKPTMVNVRVEEYGRGPDFAKYASGVVSDSSSSVGQLCFASLQVDHVDDYSEPGQMMGATMSEVHYHQKVVGIVDWAKTSAMRSAFPTIEEQLQHAGSTPQTEIVVLMNDGWKAQ
ncbi:MAG: hypothetical protein NVSMB64_19170 [Candidatus Velthaea sp.]